MASSTTMPIARERPSKVNVFNVNPKNLRKINEPRIEVGIENNTLIVDPTEPKKKKQTIEVNIADISKVKFNSSTDSLICFVESS